MSAGFRFVGGPADGELRWLPGDPPCLFQYVQELPPPRVLPVGETTCAKTHCYAYNPETNCYHHTP